MYICIYVYMCIYICAKIYLYIYIYIYIYILALTTQILCGMCWNELIRTAAALNFNFDSAFEDKLILTQLNLT